MPKGSDSAKGYGRQPKVRAKATNFAKQDGFRGTKGVSTAEYNRTKQNKVDKAAATTAWEKKYSYIDYKTGKLVVPKGGGQAQYGHATKGEDAGSPARMKAAASKVAFAKRYNEDADYRAAYDRGDLDGNFGDKLKKWGKFAGRTALAVGKAGAILGSAYGATQLAAMAGAGAAATAGSSTGLGASLHGVGASVSPLGTAGSTVSSIAGAGSAGLSTMEGGRNALSVGKTLSGSGGITGMIKGGLSGMSDLKDWTKLGLAGADMIGSIAGGFADAGDAKDAQKAANPFAKYRDKYAKKLGELYDNPESIRDTPGYKFRFDEGMRAVNRTSAAKGHRLSGNVLLEASRYGQGLADQMRGEEIDRLGGLAGATMGFSNAGYTQRGSKVGGINEALGTAGDFIGRTNYWDDDDEANT